MRRKKTRFEQNRKRVNNLITLEILELMRMLGIKIEMNQIMIYLRTSITHKNGK